MKTPDEMYDAAFLSSVNRLKSAIAGLDLTPGEQRTFKWLTDLEISTINNIASIIEKAKEAAQ